MSWFAAVTAQIKQRSGENVQINELVSMIESSLPEAITKSSTVNDPRDQ